MVLFACVKYLIKYGQLSIRTACNTLLFTIKENKIKPCWIFNSVLFFLTLGSIGSPADSEEQKNKDFGLKKLRVMVARSPEARRKLMEQKTPSSSKARRNLSLKKAGRSTSSTDTQGSETRRSRRFIDMTMNDDNSQEVKKEVKKEDSAEKKASDEDSQPSTWFSTTARF